MSRKRRCLMELSNDDREELQRWLERERRRQREKDERRTATTILSISGYDDGISGEKMKYKNVNQLSPPPSVAPKKLETFVADEIKRYLQFLETDRVIKKYLKFDYCKLTSDSYLLANVFVLFKRAKLKVLNRVNFFKLLFLANDMEEDLSEAKYNILPWALGPEWQFSYLDFLSSKDELWKKMNMETYVAQETTQAVMSVESEHKIWSRARQEQHAGAIPNHIRYEDRNVDDALVPKGPLCTPDECIVCMNALRSSCIPTRLIRRCRP